MGADMQFFRDYHAITRLLAEYVHGCDRCDAEHMSSVYWEDSWDDHGDTQAPGPEYARLAIPRIKEETQVLSHLLGQSLIDVEGDEAGAETCYLAVTRSMGEDGVPRCNQLGGRCVDRLERRVGVWKIKHRTAVRDWSVSLVDDTFALAVETRRAGPAGSILRHTDCPPGMSFWKRG